MNNIVKALAVVVFALVAQKSFANDEAFGEALNECMQSPGAAFVECARVAALRSGSEGIDIRYEMDLATGEPNSTEDEVCNLNSSGNCTLFECNASGPLGEVCTVIGYCFDSPGGSFCEYR
jgi:hypothetical protein